MQVKPYLEVGEFVSTHGIAGELKLYPWSDEPGFFLQFTRVFLQAEGGKALEIEQVRVHKNVCLVKLAGITTVEQARAYIGKTVYIARADVALAKDRVFVQDLLGAKVVHADTGEDYGVIVGITHPGRHDVYEIEGPDGRRHLFPVVKEFLEKVSPEEGLVLVRPIAGMFEAEVEKPPKPEKMRRKKKENLGAQQTEGEDA